MRVTEIFAAIHLWWYTVHAAFAFNALHSPMDNKHHLKQERKASYGERQPLKRKPTKYLLKLYQKQAKSLSGNVNLIRGVFPRKVSRTKRALKVIFKQNNPKQNELWMKDELRVYMHKPKGPLPSPTEPYVVKVFDLYSKKLVNVFKLPSVDHGWQTLYITDWRNIGARRTRNGRVGLKLVVLMGKKKLRIEDTPFRKSKTKREPYLVVFLKELKSKRIDGRDIYNRAGILSHLDRHEVLPFARLALRGREQN